MNPVVIDAAKLSAMLGSATPPVLVEVRPQSAFEREHLPGAKNNCVFEIAFLDRMPQVAPDRGVPVCVYGECTGSEESLMAAEKLCRNGYAQVFELRCGIEDWIKEGFTVEQTLADDVVAT